MDDGPGPCPRPCGRHTLPPAACPMAMTMLPQQTLAEPADPHSARISCSEIEMHAESAGSICA